MVQQIRSNRSFVKWVGIPFVLLGGLLSQNRGYRDCVSERTKPLLKVEEDKSKVKHDCLFLKYYHLPETGVLYCLPEFEQEKKQIKDPNHIVTPEEREFVRKGLYDYELLPYIIRNRTWNLVGGIHRVSPLDINTATARENLNTPFSYEVARLEDFPITVIRLNLMRALPYSEFAKGLRKNPNLQKAIKEFGLGEDSYFRAFVIDIDLNFLKSMPDLTDDEEFIKALSHRPEQLQEAIKKYKLENDPFFSIFLD